MCLGGQRPVCWWNVITRRNDGFSPPGSVTIIIISQPGADAVCLSLCRWFDATAWRGCVHLGVMPQPAVFCLVLVEHGRGSFHQKGLHRRGWNVFLFAAAVQCGERQTDRLHTKKTLRAADCQSRLLGCVHTAGRSGPNLIYIYICLYVTQTQFFFMTVWTIWSFQF